MRTKCGHQAFTLGAKRKSWKTIKCKHPHRCPSINSEIYKDGVIYYGADDKSLIVSFDVRSEDFGVIKLPEDVKIQGFSHSELVNYHGKIALVDMSFVGKVDLWVLQDTKKQEWCKICVLLPDIVGNAALCYMGTISTGEIIFAPSIPTKPLFVLYYNLNGNSVTRVEIEVIRDHLDHMTACSDQSYASSKGRLIPS